MEDFDENERVLFGACDAACTFVEQCAKFHDDNGYPEIVPLKHIINTLMTELWDRGFSQTEIRKAFENALLDMNRYAAGEEQR